MKNGKAAIRVVGDETVQTVEIIAQSIIEIAAAMRRINQSRLSRRALVALIQDQSKLGKNTIEIVLNNLEALESIWLKKPVVTPTGS